MTRRQKLLQYSHTFKYLKLNIPAKFEAGFPDEEEEMEGRQSELNLSEEKNIRK